jgi:hypothetical protein
VLVVESHQLIVVLLLEAGQVLLAVGRKGGNLGL